jgi:hypothetical protein
MQRFVVLGSLALLVSGCVFGSRASENSNASSSGGASANFQATFGDGTGPLSASAAELLGKTMGNPNPKTIAGVYAGTAVDGKYLDGYYLTEAFRIEFRDSGVAFAKQCTLSNGISTGTVAAVTAFTMSAVEVLPWGLRLAGGNTVNTPLSYTSDGSTFKASCMAELGPIDLPFCLKDGLYRSLPDGFSMCIELTENRVLFRRTKGGYAESSSDSSLERSYGVKIAN